MYRSMLEDCYHLFWLHKDVQIPAIFILAIYKWQPKDQLPEKSISIF